MFGKVSGVMIETKDLVASERFYTEILEMGVKARGEGWIVLDGGRNDVIIWQGNSPKPIIGLSGADLTAAREALQAKGLTLSATMQHPGGQHFELTDPDGNLIMMSND
jgi:catechol 2,3-dioxygenase-like lactoylglutathione lyase family enzyme